MTTQATTEPLTTDMIRALRSEANAAGDVTLAEAAKAALIDSGDMAREACAKAINAARAMDEDAPFVRVVVEPPTTTIRLTGRCAIALADALDLELSKCSDPTEPARDGLSIEDANEIASEDAGLIYLALSLTDDEILALETTVSSGGYDVGGKGLPYARFRDEWISEVLVLAIVGGVDAVTGRFQ